MDSLDKPYAVFRFKYRGKEVLRGMFGDVVGKGSKAATATVVRDKKDGASVGRKREKRSRRRDMSRDTEDRARGFTEEWVEKQSKDVGEREKETEKRNGGRMESWRRKSMQGVDESWDKSGWD